MVCISRLKWSESRGTHIVGSTFKVRGLWVIQLRLRQFQGTAIRFEIQVSLSTWIHKALKIIAQNYRQCVCKSEYTINLLSTSKIWGSDCQCRAVWQALWQILYPPTACKKELPYPLINVASIESLRASNLEPITYYVCASGGHIEKGCTLI